MNKLIVLPGNSIKNKAWGEAVVARFGSLFDESYMQSYDHWESGAETIDFDRESEKLRERVAADGPEAVHFVFAKSFGSILAFLSIHRGYVTPAQCVFFGIPLNLVDEQGIWNGEWSPLSTFTVPALAFHNQDDPVASFSFTKEKLAEHTVSSITVVPLDGEDHSYTGLEEYAAQIEAFLAL
ncbi:MAG: hypothetical protein WDZ93_01295, partial [Candidatus Paceibacterota bacterium]